VLGNHISDTDQLVRKILVTPTGFQHMVPEVEQTLENSASGRKA